MCEITGVGPVPVDTARRLLGDAVLKLVITKGVDVANVVHLGRGASAAQRIALLWSSPTCVVEGCSRTHTEIEHREDFARTRHTTLPELEHLCDGHHDLKTYQGRALVSGKGKRPFVPPEDPRHPKHHPPPGGTAARTPTDLPPPDPDAVRARRRTVARRVADHLAAQLLHEELGLA